MLLMDIMIRSIKRVGISILPAFSIPPAIPLATINTFIARNRKVHKRGSQAPVIKAPNISPIAFDGEIRPVNDLAI